MFRQGVRFEHTHSDLAFGKNINYTQTEVVWAKCTEVLLIVLKFIQKWIW